MNDVRKKDNCLFIEYETDDSEKEKTDGQLGGVNVNRHNCGDEQADLNIVKYEKNGVDYYNIQRTGTLSNQNIEVQPVTNGVIWNWGYKDDAKHLWSLRKDGSDDDIPYYQYQNKQWTDKCLSVADDGGTVNVQNCSDTDKKQFWLKDEFYKKCDSKGLSLSECTNPSIKNLQDQCDKIGLTTCNKNELNKKADNYLITMDPKEFEKEAIIKKCEKYDNIAGDPTTIFKSNQTCIEYSNNVELSTSQQSRLDTAAEKFCERSNGEEEEFCACINNKKVNEVVSSNESNDVTNDIQQVKDVFDNNPVCYNGDCIAITAYKVKGLRIKEKAGCESHLTCIQKFLTGSTFSGNDNVLKFENIEMKNNCDINGGSTPEGDTNCILSEWSNYGACTNGKKKRTRTVETPQEGNGTACGELEEVKVCDGSDNNILGMKPELFWIIIGSTGIFLIIVIIIIMIN